MLRTTEGSARSPAMATPAHRAALTPLLGDEGQFSSSKEAMGERCATGSINLDASGYYRVRSALSTLRTTASAILGATLLVAGGSMAVAAAQAYSGIPRTPEILYVYLPIAAALLALGAIVIIQAQIRYDSERR